MKNNILAFIAMCFAINITHAQEPILPIPTTLNPNTEMAKLGKQLFFDTRLSADGTVSCASCHNLSKSFGTDLLPISTGIAGEQGERNSPTVFNAVFNFKQFWDGRAETLAEQAIGPVVNPVEMGWQNWDEAVSSVEGNPAYKESFNRVFGAKISGANIQQAIAEFEKTLILPDSPFDRYLRGDDQAINEQQKLGYQRFKAYGCTGCHQGVNVGGNMFQKFGALKDINLREGSTADDLGRFEVTGNEWDKHVFKVPSLRLAVKTPPYFHDGSVATIEEAVDVMIEFQLDRQVPKEDRSAIIAFLESLVGSLPSKEAITP